MGVWSEEILRWLMMKIDPTGGVNNELGKWIQHSIGRLLCEWIVHGAWISKDHDKGRGLSYKKKKKNQQMVKWLHKIPWESSVQGGAIKWQVRIEEIQ